MIEGSAACAQGMSDGRMKDDDLVDGIVVATNKSHTNRTFFINTPKGAAVILPSLHNNNFSLRPGAYVGVRWKSSPTGYDHLKSFVVDKMALRKPPSDHTVQVKGDEIQVSCDAAFVESKSEMFYLENSYLGRMAGSAYDVRGGSMITGSVYRVCCRRTKIHETGLCNIFTTSPFSMLSRQILIRCRWGGELEDARALLQSDIGPIRDQTNTFDTRNENEHGEYEFWVFAYYRQYHSARWSMSIYDNEPVKLTGEITVERGREERVDQKPRDLKVHPLSPGTSTMNKKDGRVLDLMARLMKDHSIQDSIMENDRESGMRIKELLNRYAQKQ